MYLEYIEHLLQMFSIAGSRLNGQQSASLA